MLLCAVIVLAKLMQQSFPGRCFWLSMLLGACGALGFAQPTPARDQPSAQSSPGARPATSDFSHARNLMQQGRLEEAITELRAVEASSPELKGLDLELGTAYYKKSDYPKAIEYLKKATATDPGTNEAVQLLGLSYYLNGRPAEAIPLLERVQTWYPRANVDASYILGICYIQTKDYPNARKAFAKMFDVPAESAASYLFTARMLLRQDFGPVAEEYAHKAVALDPKLPMAHQLLGELYLYHSQIEDAIAEFREELEINPGNAAAYYKLADGYSRVQ